MTRAELEAKPNWYGTFRVNRTGKTICLMQNNKGGYYWYRPNYQGLFQWGATLTYIESSFRYSIQKHELTLISGKSP